MALAFAWAARITTIAAGMVIPGLIGYGIDYYFKTSPVFTLIGFALGMASGMWQLYRIAVTSNRKGSSPDGGDDEGTKRE